MEAGIAYCRERDLEFWQRYLGVFRRRRHRRPSKLAGRVPLVRLGELSVRLRTRDLVQRKPGRFTLERCGGCGHMFQNPRLTPAGLDFYYRDFYDGIGAETAEVMFATAARHLPRPRRMRGAGHDARSGGWTSAPATAHFSLPPREVLARHGLRRAGHGRRRSRRPRGAGWIAPGTVACSPTWPASLGAYDVVSMHHYLEHTRDPRIELDALAAVVKPGGYAEIEMPDVFSAYGRLFRSWWVPWFPPQHQHFLPAANLLCALTERGFRTVSIERGDAHAPVDLTFALIFLTTRLAPDPRLPWAPERTGTWAKRRHELAWSRLFPPTAKVVSKGDVLLKQLLRRLDQTNTYRIVARKAVSSRRTGA